MACVPSSEPHWWCTCERTPSTGWHRVKPAINRFDSERRSGADGEDAVSTPGTPPILDSDSDAALLLNERSHSPCRAACRTDHPISMASMVFISRMAVLLHF